MTKNEYDGCSVLENIDIVSPDLSCKLMFDKYVATRTPVKFSGTVSCQFDTWDNTFLRLKAADAKLRIENRTPGTNRFGLGNEINMRFGDFIDLIERGEESYYLTTQEITFSQEGLPSIVNAPVSSLMDEFPISPELFGNLVLQNANLWMGATTFPSSSGLHHDFHDNFYVVLRGEKQITLYSPAEYEAMYLVGDVIRIHKNGRFNYKNQLTRADGSSCGADAALAACKALDVAACKLAKTEETGENIGEAEDELDEALEAILDAEIDEERGGDSEDDCDDSEDDQDDCDDSEDDQDDRDNSEDDDLDSDEPFDEAEKFTPKDDSDTNKRSEDFAEAVLRGVGAESSTATQHDRKRKSNEISHDTCVTSLHATSTTNNASAITELTTTKRNPPSFSRVDMTLSEDELLQQFPLYVAARARGVTVTVTAGQMLYIPAGWFHEVKSVGPPPLGHMAFNYWFHPPDTQCYEKPYSCDFWANDWAARKGHITSSPLDI